MIIDTPGDLQDWRLNATKDVLCAMLASPNKFVRPSHFEQTEILGEAYVMTAIGLVDNIIKGMQNE